MVCPPWPTCSTPVPGRWLARPARAFSDATGRGTQKRYQDKLPPALYQTLVDNSNRRFAPAEVDQRALNGLRENLPDSASPLNSTKPSNT